MSEEEHVVYVLYYQLKQYHKEYNNISTYKVFKYLIQNVQAFKCLNSTTTQFCFVFIPTLKIINKIHSLHMLG